MQKQFNEDAREETKEKDIEVVVEMVEEAEKEGEGGRRRGGDSSNRVCVTQEAEEAGGAEEGDGGDRGGDGDGLYTCLYV